MQQVLEVGGYTVRLVAIIFAKPWLLHSVCLINKPDDSGQQGADTALSDVQQDCLLSGPKKGEECSREEERLETDTENLCDEEPPRKRCKTQSDVLQDGNQLCQDSQSGLKSANASNFDADVTDPITMKNPLITDGESDSLGGQSEHTAEQPLCAPDTLNVDAYKDQDKPCSADKELEVENDDFSTDHNKLTPSLEHSDKEQCDDVSHLQENPEVSKGM